MDLKKELRKLIFFFLSFIGLFGLSKFLIINPGLKSIPVNLGQNFDLSFGEIGKINNNNPISVFWGSTSNENFQDIYYRLNYLLTEKAPIKSIKIKIHQGLFAQKKFDGKDLNRVLPYYPVVDILERIGETGISYELVINFSKYLLGIPFRSTRELGLLSKNVIQEKSIFPYFSKNISIIDGDVSNFTRNSYFFWLIAELAVRENIKYIIEIGNFNKNKFPEEIGIQEQLQKLKKIYKDKVEFR